jgi:hypothetical protein
MRRFISIPLLAIGTVLGYGFAFHAMHHRHHDRDAWDRHGSDCMGWGHKADRTDSTRSDNVKGGSTAPPAEPKPPTETVEH